MMRRCYSYILVGGFESKLKIWVNQDEGDFVFLRRTDGSRTVRDWTERWGRPDLTYIGCPSHTPPPNRTQTSKRSLSFSLKHVGETTRSRLFGVVPGRSEHIPGLFSWFSIMSSRYFNNSSPYVLGFHHERG